MLRILIVGLSMIFLFSEDHAHAQTKINVPKSAMQGELVRILIDSPNNEEYEIQFSPVGWPQNNKIIKTRAVSLGGGRKIALLPISPEEIAGIALITIFTKNSGHSLSIEIKSSNFPVARGIKHVPEPGAAQKKKRALEKEKIDEVFKNIVETRYWRDDFRFAAPLEEMAATSPFGQIRHKKYIPIKGRPENYDWFHNGGDLRADVGTKVFAPEAGVVRLAEYFSAEGGFIMLDHGFGIVSGFMHLSKFRVKTGQIVKRGELIALSGDTATGRPPQPHLHWEIRVFGIAVSPWNFYPKPSEAQPRTVLPALPRKRGAK